MYYFGHTAHAVQPVVHVGLYGLDPAAALTFHFHERIHGLGANVMPQDQQPVGEALDDRHNLDERAAKLPCPVPTPRLSDLFQRYTARLSRR